jgi:hypothetical protein
MIPLPHHVRRGLEIKVVKQRASRQDPTLPLVSMRQAVRPVIVAHGILSNQQEAAGALADEAKLLCELTEELLRKLGRVHLLTAGSAALPSDAERTDMASRLVEAYSQVGMSWARVLSSAAKLADWLIGECDWAAVRLIADLMAEAGETAVAKHIESLLGEAQEERFRTGLAAVRTYPGMTAAEVRAALGELSSLPAHPEKELAIKDRRWNLILSVEQIAKSSGVESAATLAAELSGTAQTVMKYPYLEEDEGYKLPENRLFPKILNILDLSGV